MEFIVDEEKLTYEAEMFLDSVQDYVMGRVTEEFYDREQNGYENAYVEAYVLLGEIRKKYCCGHCGDCEERRAKNGNRS